MSSCMGAQWSIKAAAFSSWESRESENLPCLSVYSPMDSPAWGTMPLSLKRCQIIHYAPVFGPGLFKKNEAGMIKACRQLIRKKRALSRKQDKYCFRTEDLSGGVPVIRAPVKSVSFCSRKQTGVL